MYKLFINQLFNLEMQRDGCDCQNGPETKSNFDKYDITNTSGKAYFDDLIDQIMSSVARIEQNQPVHLQVDQKTPEN